MHTFKIFLFSRPFPILVISPPSESEQKGNEFSFIPTLSRLRHVLPKRNFCLNCLPPSFIAFGANWDLHHCSSARENCFFKTTRSINWGAAEVSLHFSADNNPKRCVCTKNGSGLSPAPAILRCCLPLKCLLFLALTAKCCRCSKNTLEINECNPRRWRSRQLFNFSEYCNETRIMSSRNLGSKFLLTQDTNQRLSVVMLAKLLASDDPEIITEKVKERRQRSKIWRSRETQLKNLQAEMYNATMNFHWWGSYSWSPSSRSRGHACCGTDTTCIKERNAVVLIFFSYSCCVCVEKLLQVGCVFPAEIGDQTRRIFLQMQTVAVPALGDRLTKVLFCDQIANLSVEAFAALRLILLSDRQFVSFSQLRPRLMAISFSSPPFVSFLLLLFNGKWTFFTAPLK